MTERAPAKLNLCLFLGPARAQDRRHELVTVFEPLELADTVRLEGAAGPDDEVVCPGVEGPNLAAAALAAFREATGWDGAPVRLVIDKRIPVEAGMAGGSADAAAALRLARRASGLGDDRLLRELALGLGADVPAQLEPRRVLATGVGERLREIAPPSSAYGVLVLPSSERLSTGTVFAEADRLGLPRDDAALAAALEDVESARPGDTPLAAAVAGVPLVNELEPAARALCPAVDAALDAARRAGAEHAMVAGSGPTVVGLFATPAGAEAAAAALAGEGWTPAPVVTRPLGT